MFGQRIMPEQYHHIAHLMSDSELRKFFTLMKESIKRDVEKLPAHEDFVQQYCKTML